MSEIDIGLYRLIRSAYVENGDHAFGALLSVDGLIILEAQNTVVTDSDVTRHAEMNLITRLSKAPGLAWTRARRSSGQES